MVSGRLLQKKDSYSWFDELVSLDQPSRIVFKVKVVKSKEDATRNF